MNLMSVWVMKRLWTTYKYHWIWSSPVTIIRESGVSSNVANSESIWPRNIVIFPFGNCDQQVIGLLKQVLDSLTSWQHQWRFSIPRGRLEIPRSLWKPVRFHPMPLPPWFLGETLPEMSRGVGGDSTKFHWCTHVPFVARLVRRNQNRVIHDTRKQ